MANEPQQVDLLRGDHNVIFSVQESHHESLNHRGSEDTRSARIIGPIGSVVTFFDDQEFPTGQNSLMVTKTVAGPITSSPASSTTAPISARVRDTIGSSVSTS
jgi:hypothetical protein